MGWWRIDPATGKALEGSASKLSRPPEFVLLNAVPGVDDEAEACYLGDGPWDMASTLPNEVEAIVGPGRAWMPEAVRALFLDDAPPPDVSPEAADRLRAAVAAFWADIDGCYDDDWDRPALPAERRWIGEAVVRELTQDRS